MSYDAGNVLRMARFCGDCGRNFDDCGGDYCYVRMQPARLICHDCKLKEPLPSTNNGVPVCEGTQVTTEQLVGPTNSRH